MDSVEAQDALQHCQVALTHMRDGRHAEAIRHFEIALCLDPSLNEAQRLRGMSLAMTSRMSESEPVLAALCRRFPEDPENHHCRSEALFLLHRPADMARVIEAGLQMEPADAGLIHDRTHASKIHGNYDDAITWALRGIALEPSSPGPHLDFGLLLMLAGSLASARPHYDGRLAIAVRELPGRRWLGEETQEALTIHNEQGMGDVLQIARYFPSVLARAPQAQFVVQPPLCDLLRRSFPGLTILPAGDQPPATPLHGWCMDLPAIFDGLMSKVDPAPYLRPDPARCEHWRGRLPRDRFNIGLQWSGNPAMRANPYRAVELATLAPLAAIDGVNLVNLHIDPDPQIGTFPMQDFTAELSTFDDTAALVDSLDLVISICTSVAHLSGGLGQETWILLRRPYDWRWGIEGDRTNWYGSATLLRECSIDALVARVKARMAEGRRRARPPAIPVVTSLGQAGTEARGATGGNSKAAGGADRSRAKLAAGADPADDGGKMESGWADGYVSDVDYQHGFFNGLTPASLRIALLMKGFRPAPDGDRFSYCELGYGHGATLCGMAAANPQATFWGTDFNPSHALSARRLAGDVGLENLHLEERSFAEYLELDLPQFDVIALHGVYSWVSAANRAHIVEFLRRRLKLGGVAYISYNAMPGWSARGPLRRLIADAARHGPELATARVETALQLARRVQAAKGRFFELNPDAGAALENWSARSRAYLVHELLNQDHAPRYLSEVAAELDAAKLSYATSVRLDDHLDSIALGREMQQLLGDAGDPVGRETLRDYLLMTPFRTDLFVRGAERLTPDQQAELLMDCRFALLTDARKAKGRSYGARGVALKPDMTNALIDGLARGPRSLRELSEDRKVAELGYGRTVRSLVALICEGQVSAGLDAEVEARRASTDRFNHVVLQRTLVNDDLQHLVSPVTGNAVAVSYLDRLFLLALRSGLDPVEFPARIFSTRKMSLARDGKPVPRDQIEAEIRNRLSNAMEYLLPALGKLQIA